MIHHLQPKKWIPIMDLDWQDMTGTPLDEFYTKENTKHKQIFGYAPKYIKDFAEQNFAIWSCSVIQQQPGNFIPLHYDTYSYFMDQHNISDISVIRRYNFFLEDWKPGHWMDVEDEPVTNWKAGNYLIFDSTILHGSANAGRQPKYTCQITGILNENFA